MQQESEPKEMVSLGQPPRVTVNLKSKGRCMCSASLGTCACLVPAIGFLISGGHTRVNFFCVLLPKPAQVAKPVPRCDRRCAGGVQEMCENG